MKLISRMWLMKMKQSFSQYLKKDLVRDPGNSNKTSLSGSKGMHVRGDDEAIIVYRIDDVLRMKAVLFCDMTKQKTLFPSIDVLSQAWKLWKIIKLCLEI